VLKLAVVFSLVVVAERRSDQAIVSERPFFESADPDPATGPTRAGVRSYKCPAVLDALVFYDEVRRRCPRGLASPSAAPSDPQPVPKTCPRESAFRPPLRRVRPLSRVR